MHILSLSTPDINNSPVPITPPAGLPVALSGGLSGGGSKLLQLGLEWLFMIAGFLAMVFIIYSGITWITSRGEPEKLSRAKARMTFAVIGLVIVLSAFFIVSVVLKILNVPSVSLFTPT